jgi:integrase
MTNTNIITPDQWKVPASSDNLLGSQPAPQPAPTKHQRVWFLYRSRRWRIYKRSEPGNWFLTFWHSGQRYNESLGTGAQKAALVSAKLKIDLVLDGQTKEVRALLERTRRHHITPACSTVGELLAVHERASFDVDPHTAQDYRNAFIRFLERCFPPPVEGLRLSAVLTPEIVLQYQGEVVASARSVKTDLAASRRRRGGQRVLHKVRCMFTAAALSGYSKAGLVLPEAAPFFSSLRQAMSSLKKQARAYDGPPDPKTVSAMLESWATLPRNEFLAVGLALGCGLRKGEIAKATWDWITQREGVPWLTAANIQVKNASGMISVRPLDPFWRILTGRAAREGWRGDAGGFFLDGNHTERTDKVFRRVSEWMRALGWSTQFTIHALRAYSGGQVWLKWGPAQASAWLRHSNLQVTQDHYTYLQTESERFGLSGATEVAWAAFAHNPPAA